MNNEDKVKREMQMEVTRREMARKSLDLIRVFNPLDYTFRFMFDGYWHSVPSKSTKDFPRYLATHYLKKISDAMIGDQITKKGEELKKLREKQFGKSFIDKYEENIEVWNKVPRLDDPDLIKQVADTVILGLVEEYGFDSEPGEMVNPVKPIDFRPLHEQIFDSMDKKFVSSVDLEKPLKAPSKVSLAKEVTSDN